jgi:hypothetical protein
MPMCACKISLDIVDDVWRDIESCYICKESALYFSPTQISCSYRGAEDIEIRVVLGRLPT